MPPQSTRQHHVSLYSVQRGKPVNKLEVDSLPSMDKPSFYDPPSSPSTSSDDSVVLAGGSLLSNSGNKLHPSAQFMRRGKMFAWGPSFHEAKEDRRVRKRLNLVLEQLLPEAAAEVGAQLPQNILDAEAKRKSKKRKRVHEPDYILPHLRSPSPPVTTTKLAPMLALPQSYTDILLSPSMRHTLGDDSMETGLQRTAGELLEGEKPLMQALGRLREVTRVLERDVPVIKSKQVNGDSLDEEEPRLEINLAALPYTPRDPNLIPPLPHISDTDNLWRVTQELLGPPPQTSGPFVPTPIITYTATAPGTAAPSTSAIITPDPVPTPLQRLFTCSSGLTLSAVPNPTHPGLAYPASHALYPSTTRYNLDLANQCRAVDDALERISELLADCNEYKERLEEARDRVADVARTRKKVWSVVKERAGWELDRAESSKL